MKDKAAKQERPSRELARALKRIRELEEARQSLERERSVLRTLIDNLQDCVYAKDLQGRFVAANLAAARQLGFATSEELVGKSDFDLFPPERAERCHAAEQDMLRTGEELHDHEGPTVDENKDPQERWVSTTKTLLRNAHGDIIGFVGVGRDITERKRAERKLEQERALFSTVIDNLPDHIYLKDRESRFVLANKPLALWMGAAAPEELVGKTDHDLFPQELADKFRGDELQIIESGQSKINLEETTQSASGSIHSVLTTKIPIIDHEGMVTGIVGIGRDITERRQTEEKNIRLATLVESSLDAIVGLDMNRIVTSWNKGAENVFGYTAKETIGKLSSLFMPPELDDEARELRGKIMRGEHIEGFETQRRRKDGTLIHVSLALSPIRNTDGEVVGTASIARDITGQKAIQAQIMRAQRLESLGTLAGGIAHQFNNINTVVKGYLDVLLQSGDLPDKARLYAREALKGVQRAVDITDRLQGLSGTAQSGEGAFRLDDIVRSLLPLFEKRIEAQGVTVILDLLETPPLRINRAQLDFIFASLLTNSLDALLDRPLRVLTLRSGSVPGYALLELEDTGCGIPSENLSRLFTPFFTTKGEWAPMHTSQSQIKGVGLSLAVSQSTVSQYGGRIEVESEAGTGSTFRLLLPSP
ncbi:MAG: PAS domain S-box protein [Spirochaetia bacterium]|jgi:PAS domain S-box-containing protein